MPDTVTVSFDGARYQLEFAVSAGVALPWLARAERNVCREAGNAVDARRKR